MALSGIIFYDYTTDIAIDLYVISHELHETTWNQSFIVVSGRIVIPRRNTMSFEIKSSLLLSFTENVSESRNNLILSLESLLRCMSKQ